MSMGRYRETRAGQKILGKPTTTALLCAALLMLIITTTHAVEDSSTIVRLRRTPMDPYRPLMDALYQHESVNGTQLSGDGGASRGPYHIKEIFWKDGITQLRREGFDYIADELEDYDRNVTSRWASEVIMKAVWRRYEPAAYRAVNFEVCARLHNGSRRWREKPATAEYWGHIQGLIRPSQKSKPESRRGGER